MNTNIETINARFRLRCDTLTNWMYYNPILLKGEIAVVVSPEPLPGEQAPAPRLKAGDGESTFSALPYIGAAAIDIYNWAKAAHPGDSIEIEVAAATLNHFVVTGITWDESKDKLQVQTAPIYSLIVGDKTYDGSEVVEITAADLGLDKAIQFIGISTTDPLVEGATVVGHDTWHRGEVVLYDGKEYILIGDENIPANWVLFGDEGSYALKTITITGRNGLIGGGSLEANRTIEHYVPTGGDGAAITGATGSGMEYISRIDIDRFGHITQIYKTRDGFEHLVTPVATPQPTGEAISFIDSISQAENGQITVSAKTIPAATGEIAGITKLGVSGGADTYGSAAAAETNAKGYTDAQIAALDVADAEVEKAIVTGVSEENGKITVTRRELKAGLGLAIVPTGTSPMVAFDDEVVFVFECGGANIEDA